MTKSTYVNFWKGYGGRPAYAEAVEESMERANIPDTEQVGRDARKFVREYSDEQVKKGRIASEFYSIVQMVELKSFQSLPWWKRALHTVIVKTVKLIHRVL